MATEVWRKQSVIQREVEVAVVRRTKVAIVAGVLELKRDEKLQCALGKASPGCIVRRRLFAGLRSSRRSFEASKTVVLIYARG